MRFAYAPLSALLLAAALSPASAQPGALDPTFGAAGVALGDAPSLARDVVLDADKRIVFAGAQAPAGVPDNALVGRLLPDGTPDPAFDAGGLQSIPLACRYPARTIMEAVDVTPDRAIVAAGTTGCRHGIVVRLRERGDLDDGFGTAGVFQFTSDAQSRGSAFFGVDVAADGDVVAVGREVREEPSGEIRTYLVVLRLTPEGLPDASFGTGGVVRLRVSDDLLPDSQLNDLVVFPDGRVLSTGYVLIAGSYQSIVVRLSADGGLDGTFEGGGLVVHDFGAGSSDVANALLYGPDGAVYIGGTLLSGNTFAFFGARLRYDGTRDPTFGTNGVAVVQALPAASCVARDVALDLEGRLALAGDCAQSSSQTWALARLLSNGSLDSSFGDAGVARPAVPGTTQTLYGLVRQSDGRLVAAGSVVTSGIPVWAVARILDGAPTAVEPAQAAGAHGLAASPNPAAGATRIHFSLEDAAETTLTLYDALGRQAARVEAGLLAAGAHERQLDVSGLAPGVYLLRVQAGRQVAAQALTVR